ncbi:MAG: hypothetical protein ACFFDF_24790, partial [Candidatus Odinarchaeota archaeon]
MKSITENSLKRFFIEIFQILRETNKNVLEIWVELSNITFLNQFNKFDVKEFIGNFNFIAF